MLVEPERQFWQVFAMTTNNPFGPGGPYHDPFRREREQMEALKRALGPAYELQQRMKELEGPLAHVRELQRSGVLSTAYETARSHADTIEKLKALTTPAWALTISETARTIMHRDAELIEQQRRLSSSVLDTMRAFDANRSTVAAAMAAARTGETYRRMMAEMLPRVTAFGAIAERMRMIDIMTLRASDDDVESSTVIAAEMVIETQRIAEAIAAAPSEEESAALFGEMLETISTGMTKLGPKTIAEMSTMGLMQWSGWLFGFLSFVLAIVTLLPNQSAEQTKAIAELNQKFEVLHHDNERLMAADAHASEAYLEKLQKAELTRAATLRRKPERAGDVVLRAQSGQVVAIEKKQGRWRLVVFRDPLSNQLARAWIYETALMPLAPSLGEPRE
ncbi:hypothetical protein BV95_01963 [Sphingobium chlorophenolicum]|uniref:SH3 domain-containing protein n=2 Tax=Sphingobium chlorophenolicum TaxID=46429 RepID=A0A081REX4_SPHCR|nr:hypothetical protein [Sphingobium chlorophenolicum]KEQ53747.1 hypothetical protein BV95_01963 [Sphingobium chlorophenolicum]